MPAVHVVRFEHQNTVQWGVIRQGRITPIPGEFATTGDFIRQNSIEDLDLLTGNEFAESEVKVLSPVTRNQQFVCQGANYRQHMIESGMDPDAKKFNMIFTKATSCLVAADSDLIKPRNVRFLDYEIELGLVMKRPISGAVSVTDNNLHEFIAGVVVVNDYSARDIQIPQMQFYKGKSFRTFGPVGPYLCLLGEKDMHYLKALQLRLTVNGQVRQDDSTANLVYGPAETLTELSTVQDLDTGDLIATGTPAGCALSIPSPAKQRIAALMPEATKWKLFLKAQESRSQYLKVGDVVEARIRSADGVIDLGVQRNRVVGEA
ncbi:fumarylacetoacetate hydrolase family protein [Pseudomonas sp. QE6]|uniref:fumarylacetoacetate hydrolase family protein n=1 Tax=Pseudomonas sp. QE6 TaxID=3242491 RepID=UPI0035281679